MAPAWEMLRTGNFWRVQMFEQLYLRKPPGMPWAIAGMTSLFGETEFAARGVSALAATLGAVIAWWFGRRWFGARSGMAMGLAQALMPLLWQPGRSAEIEALHNLGIQLAALAMIDLTVLARGLTPGLATAANGDEGGMRLPPVVDERLPRALRPLMAVVLGAGVVIAVLAKGPAGAPVLAGVLLAVPILRMFRLRAHMWMVVGAGLAAAVLVPVGRRVLEGTPLDQAITQEPGEFLWAGGTKVIGRVLMMLPMAFVTALPMSLAMVFPLAKEARGEAQEGPGAMLALNAGRLAAAAWLCALGIMTVAGVSNPRYAMPAACLLPAACGYAYRGTWGLHATFNLRRRTLAKKLCLTNSGAWPVLLTTAAVLAGVFLPKSKADSLTAGTALAAMMPDGGSVWADALVEARPDVLLYARKERPALRPLWKKAEMQRGAMPPAGAYILLRTDEQGDETKNYRAAIAAQTLMAVGEGQVGRYRYRVYRRTPLSATDQP